MGLRVYRVNQRSRAEVDPNLWNRFWRDLWFDLNDVVGSGVEQFREVSLGLDIVEDYIDIASSGIAGREYTPEI